MSLFGKKKEDKEEEKPEENETEEQSDAVQTYVTVSYTHLTLPTKA